MRTARRIVSLSVIPVASIVLALLLGSLLIIVSSLADGGGLDFGLPVVAYGSLLEGAFGSERALVNTVAAAAPLVLTGLAVGFGFKAGLFNIGGTGQVLVGGFVAALAGASVAELPVPLA